MCGLVGALKTEKSNVDIAKAFVFLLNVDRVRGEDSTGMCIVNGDGKGLVRKALGGPEKLLPVYGEEITKEALLLMGHNRFATKGEVVVQNAHPFVYGTLAGAHNGTLASRKGLAGDLKDFPVDSSQMIYTMSQKGVKETLEEVDGAFAITVYDAKDSTFYLARNSQRPLHIVTLQGALLYASSKWMLEGALECLGRAYNHYRKDIAEIPVHKLYKFDVKNLSKPVEEDFVGYTAPSFNYSYSYSSESFAHSHAGVRVLEGIALESSGRYLEIEVELDVNSGTVIPGKREATAYLSQKEAKPDWWKPGVRVRISTWPAGWDKGDKGKIWCNSGTVEKCEEGKKAPRRMRMASAADIRKHYSTCECCGRLIKAANNMAYLTLGPNPVLFCSYKCVEEYVYE